MLVPPESSSAVLVMISSKYASILEIGIYTDGIHGTIIALIGAAKEGATNVIPASRSRIHRRLMSLRSR